MNNLVSVRQHRRKSVTNARALRAPLPLAVRHLMRRYSLTPGLAAAIAAAAGFNLEVR